ncbi:TRAP transporter substrate-binding protein [Kineococcus esterisolvens]|uniref:TRAP transporter substrate-binding protein n=1 Tax=unclassified Kineococcus TaxID=2621656 RepID=UPI003D7D1065
MGTTARGAAALAGAAVLALSGCSAGTGAPASAGGSGESASTADRVLRVAFNQPENHPQYIALDNMGDRLAEATGGALDIEVYPNETLGAQRETIELVQSGGLDMAYVAGPLLENFNPDFVAFNLPFTFDSQEHQRETLNDPEIVSDLYSSLDDEGIHVLGAFHGGVRSVYTSTGPVNTPEDLAGQKIRVIESDTNIEMMRLMGGSGTPMGQGEVYTAIQSGVLDGGENNELIYANLKHAEIAPYYSYTRHLMFPDYLIANPGMLESLTDDQREAFEEELAAAIEEEAELWEEQVTEAVATAEAAGAQFNEVDEEAFRTAIEPLIEQSLAGKDTARELHDAVTAAAE